MIFSLIILAAAGAIAFFHYLQGLFTATISAILALVAAVLAVSYHEPLALMVGSSFPGQASAAALVVLFVVIYLVLRFAFDKLVPGNVQFPALVDKIGGAAMGLVAAMFGTGVVAIAAQSLPFGPSIGGYARYALAADREVQVPRQGRSYMDARVVDELKSDKFDPKDINHILLLPADDVVMGMVSYLSNGGSLAGSRRLASIHPDYLQELFGQRLGIEAGAKHVALDTSSRHDLTLVGVYQHGPTSPIDAELKEIRKENAIGPDRVPADEDQMLLVVRVAFDAAAADNDKIFRFSPASVRLVARDKEKNVWKNYHPIGTLADGKLLANRIDDYMFVKQRGADLVFLVNRADVIGGPDLSLKEPKIPIASGTFLEVKRMARVDLSSKMILAQSELKPAGDYAVMRKAQVERRLSGEPEKKK